MNPAEKPESANLTTEELEQLDRLASDFEKQLRDGALPSIKEFLDGVDSKLRSRLQQDLVSIELELCKSEEREQQAQTVTRDESNDDVTAEPNSKAFQESGKFPISIGEYQILNVIAIHGQGIVYRANHPLLNRQTVIKVSKHQVDEESKQTLLREGQALAALSHPNLAQVYDLQFFQDDCPYLVMEFIEGRNLAEILKSRSFTESDSVELLIKLLKALQYAHNHGIIHRDLKPANIVIRASDNEPKIIDFGLALTRSAYGEKNNDKTFGGTLCYMSPEQAHALLTREGNKSTNEQSDIFSMGAILYELLTGNRVYNFKSGQVEMLIVVDTDIDFSELDSSDVAEHVKAACKKALNKNPQDRFQSASEFADSLESKPENTVTQELRPEDSRTLPNIALLAVAIGAIGILSWLGAQFLAGENSDSDGKRSTAATPGEATGDFEHALSGFEFKHRALSEGGILIGPLFQNGPVYYDDEMRMEMTFDEECYCYFFAVNPDSTIQLCYPEDQPEIVQKRKVKSISYPANQNDGFAFTDGFGQMAFITVQSQKPLPSFQDWIGQHQKEIRAAVSESKGSWAWENDELFEIKNTATGSLRSKRPLTGATKFGNYLKKIEGSQENLRIRAITFPIRPK